jgi:hypothetical protein
MRPGWSHATGWTDWENCSAGTAADHERTPVLHDWHYEVRRLYLAAPAQAAAVEHPDTERFRKALEQVKYRDASLADAQVTALRALLAFDDEYPRSQAAAVPEEVERDAFERHIRSAWKVPESYLDWALKRNDRGYYIDSRAADQWSGWQARAALSQGDVSGEGEGS